MSTCITVPSRILTLFSPIRLALAGVGALAGVTALGSLATAGEEDVRPGTIDALCGERAAIMQALEADFAESPSSSGVTGTGALVELFTSVRGSWTIIATRPDGMSCLVASGQDWRTAPKLPRREPI